MGALPIMMMTDIHAITAIISLVRGKLIVLRSSCLSLSILEQPRPASPDEEKQALWHRTKQTPEENPIKSFDLLSLLSIQPSG